MSLERIVFRSICTLVMVGAPAVGSGDLAAASAAPAVVFVHPSGEPTWSPPGRDSPPTWSSDGTEIVFQRTRDEGFAQVWAIRPDGTGLRRVTDGGSAVGHPDACALDARLALVTEYEGVRQVVVRELDGRLRRLTGGGSDKIWPVFSPDCRRIVFVERTDPDAGRYDLEVVDVQSGAVRTVLERVRYLGWPTWFADGQWILFHREIQGYPNHIWRVRPDGTGAEAITEGDHGDYWSADASADGQVFAYSFSARRQLAWGGNPDLWIQSLETGRCRRVLGGSWGEHGQRLSPDGRLLVYWDDRDGYHEITVLDLETGARRQLTHQPAGELTRIARTQGEAAALRQAAAHPGAVLYSEHAMDTLLRRWARRARPPAVDLAERFVTDYPESRAARRALARERFRAGQLNEARAAYRRLLVESPGDADAVVRLGALHALEVRTGRSLAELDGEDPAAAAINALGYALLRGEAIEAAIDVFGWNVRRHPEAGNTHDSLGEALYWRGELDAARAAYEASLQLLPGNDNARRFLGRIERRSSESEVVPCPRWPRSETARSSLDEGSDAQAR